MGKKKKDFEISKSLLVLFILSRCEWPCRFSTVDFFGLAWRNRFTGSYTAIAATIGSGSDVAGN